MRKASHISIINNALTEVISDNRYIFNYRLGSVLPDIIPSFIYKRHRIDTTFSIVEHEVEKLKHHYEKVGKIDTYIARHLGVVSHYISDYFTYPHNKCFDKGLAFHNKWEKQLKDYIASNISSINIKNDIVSLRGLTPSEVYAWIVSKNTEYNSVEHTITNDFRYIITMTFSVLDYIRYYITDGSYVWKLSISY